MPLRISTPAAEGQFQAAKWIKLQALLETEELASLLNLEQGEALYPLAGLFKSSETILKKTAFLSFYRGWIEGLKQGIVPSDAELRKFSALGWSVSEDDFWLQEVPGERYLVKPSAPIIQIQTHQMNYSAVDGEFRPMVLSQDSIFWGLQLSFPQVYQSGKTGELLEANEGGNWELFQAARRWIRDATLPTPMLVEGKRKNLPIRLGKKCFSWIRSHPQLKNRSFSVMEVVNVH